MAGRQGQITKASTRQKTPGKSVLKDKAGADGERSKEKSSKGSPPGARHAVRKTSGTAVGKRAKRSSRGRNDARERLMARFENARPSDVSEDVFVATSPVHGKGLFAARDLKAGTCLGRLHGMPTFEDGTYVLWITDELGLELTNDLKYINHDKQPNAAYSDLDVSIVRDVKAGEELLHDYGW